MANTRIPSFRTKKKVLIRETVEMHREVPYGNNVLDNQGIDVLCLVFYVLSLSNLLPSHSDPFL